MKALADHITRVTLNDTLYNQYFEYLSVPAPPFYPKHLPRLMKEGGRVADEHWEYKGEGVLPPLMTFQEFACAKLQQKSEHLNNDQGNTARVTTSCQGTWKDVWKAGAGGDGLGPGLGTG
jgi:hypothetical protein